MWTKCKTYGMIEVTCRGDVFYLSLFEGLLCIFGSKDLQEMLRIPFALCVFFFFVFMGKILCQTPDSTRQKLNRFDLFPAISYSPETKLTLGVIGYAYLDWRGGDQETPISFIQFLAVYTTANQALFENRFEFFSPRSQWRIRGELFFQRFPDRNYGFGNSAGALVEEIEEGNAEIVNYLRFNSDRIRFAPSVLYKLRPHFWLGTQIAMETLYNYDELPDEFRFINADSVQIQRMPIDGFWNSVGPQMLWDSRDNQINPRRGWYLQADARYAGSWIGSEYNFNQYNADLRYFITPWSDHTLAVRGVGSLTYGSAPLRAYRRVGGNDFIRGYFRGTYTDNHVLAYETEYRLPLWKDEIVQQAKWWHVWKRLGLTFFLSGAQVYNQDVGPRLNEFNLAAGGGLRILFNRANRINIRVDYAFGLSPNSAGPGERQRGLYLFLGEAF
jgi:hypothetical protein